MSNFIIRKSTIIVVPEGQPIFSEMATTVSITDEAGGEYVEVSQSARVDLGKIAIEPKEWPVLREAIDLMIAECKESS